MIPRWQWAGIIILALLAASAGIYSAPNSYAYAFLSGQCRHEPAPMACHPRAANIAVDGRRPGLK
jgi:hypothetical protein